MRFYRPLVFCLLLPAGCDPRAAPAPLDAGDGAADAPYDATPLDDASSDAAARDTAVAGDAFNDADDEASLLPIRTVQSCRAADYVDRTAEAADRVLAWSHGFGGPERCLKVRAGQSVRWLGSLSTHPLEAEGGDAFNPIINHVDGLATFQKPGTFGYVCGAAHAGMYGAIHVVP